MQYLKHSLILMLLLTVSNFSFAQDNNSLELSTVVEVSQMEDGTQVMLEGYLKSQSGEDEYIFEDETGEITLNVGEDSWRGQNVNEDIKVNIVGKYTKEGDQELIEVQKLEIVEL